MSIFSDIKLLKQGGNGLLSLFTDFQLLKDKVMAIERDIDSIKVENKNKFRILVVLIIVSSFPTLQALGIQTNGIIPALVKFYFGVI
jgi:hypothetical protein